MLAGVINLEEIMEHSASEEEQKTFHKIKEYLPFVDTRQLPLEVTGNFNVKNGRLIVDPKAEIKMGKFKFQLETLHGILQPGNSIPDNIPVKPFHGIAIDNLTVKNGGLFISGKRLQ